MTLVLAFIDQHQVQVYRIYLYTTQSTSIHIPTMELSSKEKTKPKSSRDTTLFAMHAMPNSPPHHLLQPIQQTKLIIKRRKEREP
jgi:hypothetical protein